MRHRIKTIAIAAAASALTVAGMAVAHGGDRGWGGWPWHSAGKSLTYSETHLQRGGEDVTLRVDQGRVTAASDTSLSIQRNDGETVTVPVDEDTRVWGGWRHGKHDAFASHRKGHDSDDDDDDFTVADIPAGKRVLVLRTDDDEAAEAVKATGWKHGHDRGHRRGHDRDDD